MKISRYILMAAAIIMLLSSCSQQKYTQIAQTTAVEERGVKYNYASSCYEYSDEMCTVRYNMWAEGGQLVYTIFNRTDQIMRVDLTRSFLVKNGYSITATALLSDKDADMVQIAPHSKKIVIGPVIDFSRVLNCDLDISPKKDQPATMDFDYESTPMIFRSVLFCSFGGLNTCLIDNEFYVSRVTNYRFDVLKEQKQDTIIICPNELGTGRPHTKYYTLKLFTPSNGFWITYVE